MIASHVIGLGASMSEENDVQNGVMVGQNGWLFLHGGRNSVAELASDPDGQLAPVLMQWREILRARKSYFETRNIEYLHFWVPDKISVYPEQLPVWYRPGKIWPTRTVVDADLERTLGSSFLDLAHALERGKAEHDAFFRTDSHCTFEGYFVIYEAVCKALSVQPRRGLLDRPRSISRRPLDLGSKLTPVITEDWVDVKVFHNSKQIWENELVRFLGMIHPIYHGVVHRGVSVEFENSGVAPEPRRVLIFGDSYSEYRSGGITSLLAETFKTVRFVWSPDIDKQLVETFQPDIVITEMAERFIRSAPSDQIDVTWHGLNRVADFLNSKCFGGDGGSIEIGRYDKAMSP